MKKAAREAIENAIERSISHDEIVRVEIEGDSGDALAAIALRGEEIGYVMCDYDGRDMLDVWGEKESEDAEMLWRLSILFFDETLLVDGVACETPTIY